MVIAEALEEGRWLLRWHEKPEHSQHNHERSIALPHILPIDDSLAQLGRLLSQQVVGLVFGPAMYVLSLNSNIWIRYAHSGIYTTHGLLSTGKSLMVTRLLQR